MSSCRTFAHRWACVFAMAFNVSIHVSLVRCSRVALCDQCHPHRVCADGRAHAKLDALLVTRCSVGILRGFPIRRALVGFVSSFPSLLGTACANSDDWRRGRTILSLAPRYLRHSGCRYLRAAVGSIPVLGKPFFWLWNPTSSTAVFIVLVP